MSLKKSENSPRIYGEKWQNAWVAFREKHSDWWDRVGVIEPAYTLPRGVIHALSGEPSTGVRGLRAPLISAADANVELEFTCLCEEYFMPGRSDGRRSARGLSASDLYFKSWLDLPVIRAQDPWRMLAEPGLVAVRPYGAGRVVACAVAPQSLRGTRAGIKMTRCWNALLTNLGARRIEDANLLAPARSHYEENIWEQLPPYMNW